MLCVSRRIVLSSPSALWSNVRKITKIQSFCKISREGTVRKRVWRHLDMCQVTENSCQRRDVNYLHHEKNLVLGLCQTLENLPGSYKCVSHCWCLFNEM